MATDIKKILDYKVYGGAEIAALYDVMGANPLDSRALTKNTFDLLDARRWDVSKSAIPNYAVYTGLPSTVLEDYKIPANYKGRVDIVEDLDELENVQNGDVYRVFAKRTGQGTPKSPYDYVKYTGIVLKKASVVADVVTWEDETAESLNRVATYRFIAKSADAATIGNFNNWERVASTNDVGDNTAIPKYRGGKTDYAAIEALTVANDGIASGNIYMAEDTGKFYIAEVTGSTIVWKEWKVTSGMMSAADYAGEGATKSVHLADFADKLKNAVNIDGVSFDGSENVVTVLDCSTVAGTAAKDITFPDNLALDDKTKFSVRFANGNTIAEPYLNIVVGNAAAVSVPMRRGAYKFTRWEAGMVVAFTISTITVEGQQTLIAVADTASGIDEIADNFSVPATKILIETDFETLKGSDVTDALFTTLYTIASAAVAKVRFLKYGTSRVRFDVKSNDTTVVDVQFVVKNEFVNINIKKSVSTVTDEETDTQSNVTTYTVTKTKGGLTEILDHTTRISTIEGSLEWYELA